MDEENKQKINGRAEHLLLSRNQLFLQNLNIVINIVRLHTFIHISRHV